MQYCVFLLLFWGKTGPDRNQHETIWLTWYTDYNPHIRDLAQLGGSVYSWCQTFDSSFYFFVMAQYSHNSCNYRDVWAFGLFAIIAFCIPIVCYWRRNNVFKTRKMMEGDTISLLETLHCIVFDSFGVCVLMHAFFAVSLHKSIQDTKKIQRKIFGDIILFVLICSESIMCKIMFKRVINWWNKIFQLFRDKGVRLRILETDWVIGDLTLVFDW